MEYHSHCDRGHEWTEENTYTMPSGTKICYACNRSTNWANTYLLPSGTKVCRACNKSTHWANAGFADIEMYFGNKRSGLDPL